MSFTSYPTLSRGYRINDDPIYKSLSDTTSRVKILIVQHAT